jgi:hypothetical protein
VIGPIIKSVLASKGSKFEAPNIFGRKILSDYGAYQVPTFIVVLVATPIALSWLPKVETA